MNLRKLLLTANECYKTGKIITPKGIMLHSTGANNPYVRRYVNPDDGMLGVNTSGNHWNQLNPDGRQVCVHAFIGLLKDGSVCTYQTLPWNYRGWHGGKGDNGSVNDTHIGFEICEDGLTDAGYFAKVDQEAVELCAYLCKEYKLDPMADGVLICHSEGYKRGIASNHSDVMHWFPKHGKSMDTFRAAVKAALGGTTVTSAPTYPTLRRGDKGEDVKTLQGLLGGITADAIFGAATEERLKQFQAANGLVSDGVCGAKSWAALNAKEAQPATTVMPPYRVRKAANDAASQVGAFTVLDNAIKCADEHKPNGYKVFDVNGILVYEPFVISVTSVERDMLYKIVQAEAGGEDEKGKILVANVIFNRVKAKTFPSTIYDVVFQPMQFEPTRNGAYDKAVPSQGTRDAVQKALSGIDYSQGALYFRTIKGATPECWHETACARLLDHGCHRFYL